MKRFVLLMLIFFLARDVVTEANCSIRIAPTVEQSIFNGELLTYVEKIAFKESTNNHKAIGVYGHLGLYQHSKSILKRLGFDATPETFLNDPKMQDQAMLALLLHNRELLKPYIKKYEGKEVMGIRITESGILACAHLVGYSAAVAFLKHEEDPKDGLGTKASKYAKMFGGYNLNLNNYD